MIMFLSKDYFDRDESLLVSEFKETELGLVVLFQEVFLSVELVDFDHVINDLVGHDHLDQLKNSKSCERLAWFRRRKEFGAFSLLLISTETQFERIS